MSDIISAIRDASRDGIDSLEAQKLGTQIQILSSVDRKEIYKELRNSYFVSFEAYQTLYRIIPKETDSFMPATSIEIGLGKVVNGAISDQVNLMLRNRCFQNNGYSSTISSTSYALDIWSRFTHLPAPDIVGTISPKASQCNDVSYAFINTFQTYLEARDPNIFPSIGAVFSGELLVLMKEPEVQSYLTALQGEIDNPKRTGRLNLWEFTLAAASNDKNKALKWLAVLFQDTEKLPHIYLLQSFYRNGTPLIKESINKLHYLNLRLGHASQSEKAGQDLKIDFYPSEVGGPNLQTLYHYYVIAYAALKTAQDSGLNQKYAKDVVSRMTAAVAYMLNTLYEDARNGFIPGLNRVPADGKASDEGEPDPKRVVAKMVEHFFLQVMVSTDPTSGDLKKGLEEARKAYVSEPSSTEKRNRVVREESRLKSSLHDKYIGFRGACIGAGIPCNLTYEDFSEQYLRDPKGFMKSLINK